MAKLTKEEKKASESADVEVWSKKRAETLAKANRRITNGMLTSAFESMSDFNTFRRNSMGFWFYNGGAGCYTFLPFFYGWGSPYGSSYSTSVYAGYEPPRWNANGYGGYPNNGSGNSNNNTSSSGSSSNGGSYRPPTPPPAPMSNPSGNMGGAPRMIDPDTGARMPRKVIDPSRP